MFNLSLEKVDEPEIKLATFAGTQRKQGNSRKNICFTDLSKMCGSQQSGKFLRRWAYQPYTSYETLYAVQKATVRSREGTINWFKINEGVLQG